MSKEKVSEPLRDGRDYIVKLEAAGKGDESLKEETLSALGAALAEMEPAEDGIDEDVLGGIKSALDAVDLSKAPKRSTVAPRYGQAVDAVVEILDSISKPHPSSVQEARQAILRGMPSFVYYANYGNLDSEIYLPRVIQNMSRTDLGSKEEAKTRTLRVLFEFVNLNPTGMPCLMHSWIAAADTVAHSVETITRSTSKKGRSKITSPFFLTIRRSLFLETETPKPSTNTSPKILLTWRCSVSS